MTDHRMTDHARRRLSESITAVAERLRELADDVDRISTMDGKGAYRQPMSVASQVHHAVSEGVNNLRVDTVLNNAGDVYEGMLYDLGTNDAAPADKGVQQ